MAQPIDLTLEPRLHELLSRLAAFFAGRGIEAYATGGFLRDSLLGRTVHDIDVSIAADPLAAAPELAAALGTHSFPLHEEHQQARVLLPSDAAHVDLLPLRGSIEDDLRGRDYTIDALAAPLADAASGTARLIDPTGGLDDLRAGTVRLVSEQALIADPLRLLRGVRLATQLGFRVEPRTADAIGRQASLLPQAAAERQRDELMRTMEAQRAAPGLRLLEELGLLDHLLPEMSPARGAEQPKEHEYDVLGHSFAAVEALDALLSEEEPRDMPWRRLWRTLWGRIAWWSEAREYFRAEVAPETPRSALLKLTGFLHDIGKPYTRTFDDTGRMRFFGHSDVGAGIAARLLRRLHFSSREIALVRAMIDAHLRPVQMAQQGAPSRRAIYRFFRDTGDAGIDTLFLSLADHLGTVGPRVSFEGFAQHVAVVDYILEKRLQETEVVAPVRLLGGDELMAELELSPGPLVGELLEVVREAQAAGEVASREEALALARRRLEESRAAAG